jgi:hypothetical protein
MRLAYTYRGSRPEDVGRRSRKSLMLKAARIRRGISRREMDKEREAVRRWLLDGTVNRGFTEANLHAFAQTMAQAL